MESLIPVLGQIKDLGTLVLVLALAGLGWLHITMIRENRADRQVLVDLLLKNTEAQAKTAEALNNLRIALSALTGKPQ